MSYELLIPEILVGTLALLLIIIDLFINKEKKHFLAHITAFGISAIIFITIFVKINGNYLFDTVGQLSFSFQGQNTVFQGFVFDRMAFVFKEIFLVIALFVTYLSIDFFKDARFGRGEIYPLFLCVVLGMMFMVSATELILLFVAIELTSIPLYIMAAFKHKNNNSGNISGEAGLKYFILGSLASALLLFGMSLIYAYTGSSFISEIAKHLTFDTIESQLTTPPALVVGLLFVLGGLAFKITAAPFHMWAPDVYEGGPAPVIAFLSVAPKGAVIAVLIRLFITYFSPLLSGWTLIFSILAVISMFAGNLLALHQENVKRMLAYSGIAQVGYVLAGLASAKPGNMTGVEGAIFYLIAYTVTNLAAFGVIIYLSSTIGKGEFVNDYKGLAKRSPWLALVMLVSFLSLAGLPPLAGFIGKFYLFLGAVKSGLVWLAAIGVVNSVISLFYYLRIAKAMYLEEVPADASATLPSLKPASLVLWITLFAIITLGVYPAPLASLSSEIFKMLIPL